MLNSFVEFAFVTDPIIPTCLFNTVKMLDLIKDHFEFFTGHLNRAFRVKVFFTGHLDRAFNVKVFFPRKGFEWRWSWDQLVFWQESKMRDEISFGMGL